MLRALRGRPGLVGLVGAWAGGGALVACDPVAVLGVEDDPFGLLARGAVMDDPGGRTPFVGGGWFGLWGYQLGRRLERLPAPPARPMPQPDHWLARYEWVLRQDAEGRWSFESLVGPEQAALVLDRLEDALTGESAAKSYRFGEFSMSPAPADHAAAVARTIEHIAAGDIFQANLCARLEAEFEGDPLDVFCAGVRALAPAYAAFLDTGDRAVASFSPELFLRRRGRTVLTSPIKGTRPLEVDPAVLVASTKDRAENVMIVDLMRNDLGRVCEPGSITVPALARAEACAGVRHLVSEVTGTLRAGMRDADLMRAAFPPGSVTGAPKVRAMELINQLETTGRELYTGAIGYASPTAGLETSVVIRTLEFGRGRTWLGIGGGIVADSRPEAELAECFAKAAPVLAAVGARLGQSPAAAPTPSHVAIGSGGGCREAPVQILAGPRPDPTAGVFTTVLACDGTPVLAEAHLRRLEESAAALGLPCDRDDLAHRLHQAAAGGGRRRIRLTVAADRVDVHLAPVSEQADPAWQLEPVVLPGGLGAHKWADRRLLDQAPADASADAEREPLLVDADGAVLETARANVFVVADDGVHTPPLDGRILPGTARAVLLDLLHRHGIPTYQHELSLTDLTAAAEVFATNAVRGVVPVSSCATVGSWPVGPLTTWLRSTLDHALRGRSSVPRIDAVPSGPIDARVLLVDNYDSFSHNLAQYVEDLGARVEVIRNDARTVDQLTTGHAAGAFTHVILSPGPGRPDEAGICVALVRRLTGRVPILGVCLGHQAIGEAYGARVARASKPVHGKPALIHHDGRGVFAGIDGPCVAARYHSLAVNELPAELLVTARTGEGTVMGIRHRQHPTEGVQIHPESILTPTGHLMVANFLHTPANGRARPTHS